MVYNKSADKLKLPLPNDITKISNSVPKSNSLLSWSQLVGILI